MPCIHQHSKHTNLMNVILHIGEGKTGTTSIQSYLSSARSLLREEGILYLTPSSALNHVCLAARLGAGVRVSPDNLSEMRATCDQLFDKLKIYASDSSVRSIVISVENIFGATPNLVLSYLQNYFDVDCVHVVAYIRDPISQYISRMQQMVKASFLIVPPHRYMRDVASPVIRWIDKIGLDRVHIKPFFRKGLIGEDVVCDFLSQICSISDIDAFTQRKFAAAVNSTASNAGINVEQMSIAQSFRRIVYPSLNNVLQRRSTRLIRFFEAMNSHGALGSKPRLDPAISSVIATNNLPFVTSLVKLFPCFSVMHDIMLQVGDGNEGDVLDSEKRLISVADLFSDCSPSALNLYRFLCLPIAAKNKAPSDYLETLGSHLKRCNSPEGVSAHIYAHARKAVALAVDKGLPQVQSF